jgi:hypothetical protein
MLLVAARPIMSVILSSELQRMGLLVSTENLTSPL